MRATVAFAAIITGQVGVSLLCDTFGWLNDQQQDLTPGHLTPKHLIGAGLPVAGVMSIGKF